MDLANPYAGGNGDWAFAGLLPAPAVHVADGPGTPFDRLTTGPVQRVGDPARITTIVTTYEPGPGLLTAVRSLTAQTWTNHEILIVDDGSPHGHDAVLDKAAALDPRVRVIRLSVNGGTYVARNAGLDAATGDFVTFQDSDDWSHPLRLERQVAPLLAGPEVFSTTSAGMRVTPELLVSRVGVRADPVVQPVLADVPPGDRAAPAGPPGPGPQGRRRRVRGTGPRGVRPARPPST